MRRSDPRWGSSSLVSSVRRQPLLHGARGSYREVQCLFIPDKGEYKVIQSQRRDESTNVRTSTRIVALLWALLVGSAVTHAANSPALEQNYPAKPVHIIEPFGLGGGPDLLARTLAPAWDSQNASIGLSVEFSTVSLVRQIDPIRTFVSGGFRATKSRNRPITLP